MCFRRHKSDPPSLHSVLEDETRRFVRARGRGARSAVARRIAGDTRAASVDLAWAVVVVAMAIKSIIDIFHGQMPFDSQIETIIHLFRSV